MTSVIAVRAACIFRTSLVPLLLLASGAGSLWSQSGTAGAFLRVGLGARAKSMGDAYTALAEGIEASYYNPAGLPFLDKREVVASYRVLSLDRHYSFLGFGVPIRPRVAGSAERGVQGGLALAWIRAGVADIDGRDSDGRHFGDLSNSEDAFLFSFALNPARGLGLGLSVKIVWNRLPDLGINGETVSASGVGFDFGLLYSPANWLSLGVTVKEINAKYRWNSKDVYGEDEGSETRNDFPKSLRTAVAFRPPKLNGVVLAIDYEQFYASQLLSGRLDDRLHIGAEGRPSELFRLRGGFDGGSLTAGAGYQFELLGVNSELNYAFTTPGDRPEEEHVFTWVFQF